MICLLLPLFIHLQTFTPIPQKIPSKYQYGLGEKATFKYVVDGREVQLPVAASPETRFMQSGDCLIINNAVDNKGLHVFKQDTLVHRMVEAPASFFFEWDGAHLYGGSFDKKSVFVSKFDKLGTLITSDVIESAQRHVLYSGGKMSAFIQDDLLHLWVPAHDLFLVYDKNLELREQKEVPLPSSLKNFDGQEMENYLTIMEDPDTSKRASYCSDHQGDILRLEPVALISFNGEPVFTYNILELAGTLLDNGEPATLKYSLFISLDGASKKRTIGNQFVGLADDKLIEKTWDSVKKSHYYTESAK